MQCQVNFENILVPRHFWNDLNGLTPLLTNYLATEFFYTDATAFFKPK